MLDFEQQKKGYFVTAPSKTMLTEAIAAARAGDRSRAQDLLSRLLRADSSNAEYWVWMSAVVESKRERIYCLESAIKLDPTNRAAMRGLVILGARTPEEAEIASAVRIPRRQVAAIATGPSVGRGIQIPWKWVGSGALGLVAIAAIWGLARVVGPWLGALAERQAYRPASTLPPVSPTSTTTPLPGTPTATPIPAANRVMRTPISTELAGTPLSLLVSATSTPTPVLGVTPHVYGAYDAGIKALIRGDYELALEYMTQVTDADPDLPDAHYFRGEALRLMGDIGESIKAYDQSVNTDPDYAPVYLGRGRALLLRNTDAALNDLNRALRLDPYMTEAYLELGTYYASNKLWLKLETTMEAALEVGVTTPMIFIRLSEAQIILDKPQEALENALEGSANDPTLLPGYLAVGRAYVAVGVDTFEHDHFSAALWPLKTYIIYTPEDHRGLAYLGRAQVNLGQYEEAMTLLNYAIELQDRYAPAYLARGILNAEIGEYEVAIDDLTLARRYSPASFDRLFSTGRAYFLMGDFNIIGDFNDTLDFINPAIAVANQETDFSLRGTKLAECYALRAQVYENINRLDDAIREWTWVLSLENVRPETRAIAETRVAELTGQGPTRTPTASPSDTPTPTPSATATRPSPTATLTKTSTTTPSKTPTP